MHTLQSLMLSLLFVFVGCGDMFDNKPRKPQAQLTSIGSTLREGDAIKLTADQIAKLRSLCQGLEAKKLVTFPAMVDKEFVYSVDHRGCGQIETGTTTKRLSVTRNSFELVSGIPLKFGQIEGHRSGQIGAVCRLTSDGMAPEIYNMIEDVGSTPPSDTSVYKLTFVEGCPGAATGGTLCLTLDRAVYDGSEFRVSETLLLEVYVLQNANQGIVYHRKKQSNECVGGVTYTETLSAIGDP